MGSMRKICGLENVFQGASPSTNILGHQAHSMHACAGCAKQLCWRRCFTGNVASVLGMCRFLPALTYGGSNHWFSLVTCRHKEDLFYDTCLGIFSMHACRLPDIRLCRRVACVRACVHDVRIEYF